VAAVSLAACVALGTLAPALLAPTPARAADPGAVPALPRVAAPASGASEAATEVIVRYRPAASAARRADARAKAQVSRVRAVPSARLEVVRPERGQSVAAAVAALNADPAVLHAEPDAPIRLATSPSTEPWRRELQWGLENYGGDCVGIHTSGYCRADADIDAIAGWANATGAGVTVAVLDDGLDFSHEELEGRGWVNPGESGPDGLGGDREDNGVDDDANGYVDDVNGVNLCHDAPSTQLHVQGVDWHGTAVGSVIGAASNDIAMAGVAPGATLMAVRWLVRGVCESTSTAIRAIDYAVANGADVINASWGGDTFSPALLAAVQRANDAGVLLVAAAGNESSSDPFYPAAFDAPNVLSVAAMRPDGYLADFSNYGSLVDIAAPGEQIVAAYVDENPGEYALVDGTSFAAPHVAGIAALLGESRPLLLEDAAALRAKLIDSGWMNTRTDGGITRYGRVADAGYAVDVMPPSAPGSVRAKARSGYAIGSSSVPMIVSWAASSDASGIESYRVRYRKVGATPWTTVTSATTAQNVTISLAYSTAYEILVASRDRGGNYTTTILPVKPTLYSESSSRVTYGGSWSLSTLSGHSGGKARYTGTAGRWAQFSITGRSFAWVAPKGPTRGSAKVYLDGKYVATVSLYSRSTAYRRVVFAASWGSVGDHVIRIVVSGTSGHPRVDVDAGIVAR
jgi:subtilisin family serine protease